MSKLYMFIWPKVYIFILTFIFCSSLCGLWVRVPSGRAQAFTMSVSYSYMKGMCRCRVLVFVANYFHMILIIVKYSFVVTVKQLDFYANVRIYHWITIIKYAIISLTRKCLLFGFFWFFIIGIIIFFVKESLWRIFCGFWF